MPQSQTRQYDDFVIEHVKYLVPKRKKLEKNNRRSTSKSWMTSFLQVSVPQFSETAHPHPSGYLSGFPGTQALLLLGQVFP